jgi:DNA modification methylase
MELNRVYNADCLGTSGICLIPDKSIDMILADNPYGTTQNKWDLLLPIDKLWSEYCRVTKDDGAIVLTAQSPFDKYLACSNIKMFRYEWIWEKSRATGFFNANKAPLKAHENILVFYKKLPVYNPQKTTGHMPVKKYVKHKSDGSNYGKSIIGTEGGGQTDRYPRDVIYFEVVPNPIHPTQKPVPLFEYFIKTYTNEGDTVLDNCIGYGTTGIAARLNNRNFIGFDNGTCEKEGEYYGRYWADIANEMIDIETRQLRIV